MTIGYELFEEYIKENNAKIIVGVSKKCTTKELLEKLNKIDNIYVYNNNEYTNTIDSNMIIVNTEEKMEALISTFDFLENTIANTSSCVLKIYDEEKASIYDLYNSYIKGLNSVYKKLNQELIDEFEKEHQLRNIKASTICKEMYKDEIIKSFRNIGQYEDKEDYLKMLEIKNEIKKSKLEKSEVIYANDSEQDSMDGIDFSDLDSDLDLDLDLDIDIDIEI